MKLPAGLGFVLLLMLPNLRQVAPQKLDEWNFDETTPSHDSETMAENSSGLSGDGEHLVPTNQTSEDPNITPATTEEPENQSEEPEKEPEDDTTTLTTTPQIPLNSSEKNPHQKNESFTQQDNTTSSQRPTTASPKPTPAMSNDTGLNNDTVTLQPETNSTVTSSGSTNVTVVDTFETQNSTTSKGVNSTTAYPPVAGNTTLSTVSPASSTSTVGPANATTVSANTTKLPTSESTTAQITKSNRTGGSFDMRGNSERGVSSDIKKKAKSQAWGAIVGIGVAVGIVALVVYVIMKRRSHRDFSHRKLVEDTPPDPVLRLDNSEPLDLKFDGSGYYNPGVQGDNIQMTNFPRGHSN